MANQAIQDGVIDAVALGRALLADAHWAEKARAGKEDDIRPCIGCNNGCMARIFNGLPLQCAVNAEVMAERNSQLILAQKQKQIAIIGGGIAGMECARIAAMRGYDVTIYEKENRLGGATVAASVPEFKDADRRLLRWYEKQIADCGVNVVCGREMNVQSITELSADEIVIAQGAKPKIPPIPGVQLPHVVTAEAVLLDKVSVGEKIVIIGGGQVGCELALWLKEKGKQVTLLEAMPALMNGSKEPIFVGNKMMLEDMLKFAKIDIRLRMLVKEIQEKAVVVQDHAGEISQIPADTVILSVGYQADNRLYQELSATLEKPVHILGDASVPRNIMYAVKDGAAIGRML